MAQLTQMTEELHDCFVKTAVNIMKYYGDEEEWKKKIDELRDTLKDNCILSTKLKTADEIKDRLTGMLESDPEGNAADVVKKYKAAVSQIHIDPSEDNRLILCNRQIENLIQANQAASTKGPDDTDSDIRLMGQDINVIDPISKMRMNDPVRNIVCGHVYDRGNLVAMLQRNRKTKCPVAGCTNNNYVELHQCRTDIVTKTFLEKNPA